MSDIIGIVASTLLILIGDECFAILGALFFVPNFVSWLLK